MLRPIGEFWDLDSEGFIINDAAPEKIVPPYAELVGEVRRAYIERLGESLHSVYIRGTVARGIAVEGVSDLDSFAFIEGDSDSLDLSWTKSGASRILSRHSCVTGVDLIVLSLDELGDEGRFSELGLEMVTQSVCVSGEDLIPSLPTYKPGILTANNDICQIEADIREALSALEGNSSPENTRYWCRRVSKNMVRAGFSLTVLSNHRFTRDLYPCYRSFAEFYPGSNSRMKQAAEYVLEPFAEAARVSEFFEDFGAWISDEANLWLEEHNPSRELALKLSEFSTEARFIRAL